MMEIKAQTEIHEVSKKIQITIYGFDFSNTKILYETIENKNLIITSLFDALNDRFFNIESHKLIEKIPFQTILSADVAKLRNKEVFNQTLISDPKSIESIIKGYSLTTQEGTGLVFIVKSFDKKNKNVELYATVFDIRSRSIIGISKYIGTGGKFGLENFWGTKLFDAEESFIKKGLLGTTSIPFFYAYEKSKKEQNQNQKNVADSATYSEILIKYDCKVSLFNMESDYVFPLFINGKYLGIIKDHSMLTYKTYSTATNYLYVILDKKIEKLISFNVELGKSYLFTIELSAPLASKIENKFSLKLMTVCNNNDPLIDKDFNNFSPLAEQDIKIDETQYSPSFIITE
ncbi:MAG: hypothetical protein NTW31_14720 [Bacteroidetes bacterium]|nr:hypothetical protein [Bacteroidota bacterium]